MSATESPSARPALASLHRARELFLLGRRLPDGIPEDVVAAWKRARFFGVRHDVTLLAPETPPKGADSRGGPLGLPAESPLLAAARPVLERIAPALGPGQTSLLLTDERLRLLWANASGPRLPRRGLSEQAVGHNSAALALRTRHRAEVHGPEHFLDVWQQVSAVSVPLRAPDTGQTLGTVTVAGALCADRGPHPGAPLAEAAAVAVEAELLARARGTERVLLDAYLRAAGDQGRAVLALDGCNRLVSTAAGRLLSPEALEALERSTAALLRDTGRQAPAGATEWAPGGPGACAPRPHTPSGAAHGPDTATVPALSPPYRVRLPDGAGCTATLMPVSHQGAVVGAVAVLEPAPNERVTPAGPGVVGTAGPRGAGAAGPRGLGFAGPRVVGAAGRSLPWRHTVGRARELAGSGEYLLLVGERGTGKTTLAREVAPGSSVADAAERELPREIDALKDGQPLVLRHVENLAQSDTAALNSLLEARPGVPLVVTYTPGTPPSPCLQRLLDTLATRSVTLPTLRERPDDIRELLAALAPRPAPGQPPLSWTLDALRALEQHPWPGNVTELAHLVRALAEHRRATGPVRRAELPDPVREGPAPRTLSPIEHAERAAILEALRLHGGNKARTAAALGIARATLYRKLRGYRS